MKHHKTLLLTGYDADKLAKQLDEEVDKLRADASVISQEKPQHSIAYQGDYVLHSFFVSYTKDC